MFLSSLLHIQVYEKNAGISGTCSLGMKTDMRVMFDSNFVYHNTVYAFCCTVDIALITSSTYSTVTVQLRCSRNLYQ
jgi:hypothetical protein